MENPCYAAYYADNLVHQTVRILENRMIAKDTFKVRFHSPQVASKIVPGQFLMVRVSGDNDPLLGRAFALHDTSSSGLGDEPWEIVEFVYLVGGKMTKVGQVLFARFSELHVLMPISLGELYVPIGLILVGINQRAIV